MTATEDVNDAWMNFQQVLSEAVNECVPLVKINNLGKINPPWFNNVARRAIRKKYFAWKRYRQSPNFTRYQEYVKRRNQVTRKLSLGKVKREYERNLCKKIKKNAKAFYLYVNSHNKIKSPVSQLM